MVNSVFGPPDMRVQFVPAKNEATALTTVPTENQIVVGAKIKWGRESIHESPIKRRLNMRLVYPHDEGIRKSRQLLYNAVSVKVFFQVYFSGIVESVSIQRAHAGNVFLDIQAIQVPNAIHGIEMIGESFFTVSDRGTSLADLQKHVTDTFAERSINTLKYTGTNEMSRSPIWGSGTYSESLTTYARAAFGWAPCRPIDFMPDWKEIIQCNNFDMPATTRGTAKASEVIGDILYTNNVTDTPFSLDIFAANCKIGHSQYENYTQLQNNKYWILYPHHLSTGFKVGNSNGVIDPEAQSGPDNGACIINMSTKSTVEKILSPIREIYRRQLTPPRKFIFDEAVPKTKQLGWFFRPWEQLANLKITDDPIGKVFNRDSTFRIIGGTLSWGYGGWRHEVAAIWV